MEYTPYTLPLIVAAVVAIGLAVFVLWRHRVPGRITFALLMLAVAIWSAGYALEISATDYASKVFWAKVQYLGIGFIPLLWLRFVVLFVGESTWLTSGRFAWLAVVPLLTVMCAWFNERLHLIWASITVDNSLGFAMLDFEYGPGLWAYAVYSYVLLLVGALVLFRAIVRLPRLGARQGAVVLVAALAPWSGNALYLAGANPFPLLDLTPFAFTLTGLVVVWGMGRFQFMSTVPVAHRAIIEGMQAGVVALDTSEHVVAINPAAERMFDLRRDDVVGQPVERVFASLPQVVEWLTEPGETTMGGALVTAGARRHLDVRTMLLYDRRRPAGRLITFHDISKLAEAERDAEEAKETAEAANRAKSEFLANVSHEIRTPLNAIMGMTDLALEGELSDKQRDYLQVARSSADSLLSIINDILDFSKIEASKLALDEVDFDLPKMVHETVKMLSATVADKPLTLGCTIAPDVPRVVVGDPLRLRQVLFNLLSNAIKFTERGEVGVDLRRDEEGATAGRSRLRFAVSDTGIGISPQDRKRIFESFAQADASTTRVYGGTGLGLSISSYLVGLMDGSIEVDSELGKGSTFTFSIQMRESDADADSLGVEYILSAPRRPARGAVRAGAATADVGAGRAKVVSSSATAGAAAGGDGAAQGRLSMGMRVLVADDNIINQRMTTALLESRGNQVTVVGDGQEAVEALADGSFDIVLMDVQMPRLDGVEATRRVRSREEGSRRHVPIVAITAHAMAGDRDRFLEAGMDAYVPKPIDAKVLFRTMGQLVTSSPDDSAAKPVLDREAALEKLAGDEELLVEIIDLYLEDTPQVFVTLRAAVDANDADGVRKAAHRIKGSVGTLAAMRAFEAARELEEVGREGDLDGLAAAVSLLEAELEQLAEALGELRAELSG